MVDEDCSRERWQEITRHRLPFPQSGKNPRPADIEGAASHGGPWGGAEKDDWRGMRPTDCQAICQAQRVFRMNKAARSAAEAPVRYCNRKVTET